MKRELWPETKEQRLAEAKIGEADIAECKARMQNLQSAGGVVDSRGFLVTVSAARTKAMITATKSNK